MKTLNLNERVSGTYTNGVQTWSFRGTVEEKESDTAGGRFTRCYIKLDEPLDGRERLIVTLGHTPAGRSFIDDSRFSFDAECVEAPVDSHKPPHRRVLNALHATYPATGFGFTLGRKFARIFKQPGDVKTQSAIYFVDQESGDVYQANSWKQRGRLICNVDKFVAEHAAKPRPSAEMTYADIFARLLAIEESEDGREWRGNLRGEHLERLFRLELVEWSSEGDGREYFELSQWGAKILSLAGEARDLRARRLDCDPDCRCENHCEG